MTTPNHAPYIVGGDTKRLAELIADAWGDWKPVTERHPNRPWDYLAARLIEAGVQLPPTQESVAYPKAEEPQ